MPLASEGRVLSSGSSWNLSTLSDMMWNFFNIAYIFFRSLIEPLVNISTSQGNSNSRGGRGPPRPPRPPNRGFRSFSDTIDTPGNFPMAGG